MQPAEGLADPNAAIECAPGWPNRCNVEINAGEKARFDGVLMSPDMAIFYLQAEQGEAERLQAAITATTAKLRADFARDTAVMKADHKRDTDVLVFERDAYKKAADRPFYEHPIFVAGVTVVVMSALYILAQGTEGVGAALKGAAQ